MRKIVPNAITSMSLLSGVIGVFFVFDGNFHCAMYALLAAALFDFLDGFAARLLHATSKFGVEMDSLSDMVSFGVLPGVAGAMFISSYLGVNSMQEFLLLPWLNKCMVFVPLLIVVCSALRLAKFNIDDRQTSSFIGLPTPANALMVISFILFMKDNTLFDDFPSKGLNIMMSLLFLLSALILVFPLPLFALKFKNFQLRSNWYRYLIIIVGVISVTFFEFKAFIIVIPFYIILSTIISVSGVKKRS